MMKNFNLKTYRNKIILGVVFCAMLFIFWYLFSFIKDDAPKKVYQAAVITRDEEVTGDSEVKRSLKYGDVLLLKEDGRPWSTIENVSYLIIKMNLTEDQANKIVMPKTRKLSKDEIEKELDDITKNGNMAEDEINNFKKEAELREEIEIMRQYRIKMEKYFPGFTPNDLMSGQPYQAEIYDWRIVDEK